MPSLLKRAPAAREHRIATSKKYRAWAMEGPSLPARGREHATLRRVARERENPKDLPSLGPTRPPQRRSRRVNFGPVTLQRAQLPYLRVDVAVDCCSHRMVMDFNPQHSSTSRVFRGTKGVSLGGIGVR